MPAPATCAIAMAVWLAWLMAGKAVGADARPLKRYEATQSHMGSLFTIVLYAPDQPSANRASRRAFARIAELDDKLSDYDSRSELSRLGQSSPTAQPVPVSQDLWNVLVQAQAWSQRTGGAFDVTVGPLTKLWRQARLRKQLPDGERLEEARQSVGYPFMTLHPQSRSVSLERPGMRLDLGAIAKGYAADEALRAMRELGIERALVNAAGNIAIAAAPPDEDGWKIGVAPLGQEAAPSELLELAECGIATSGDAWQYIVLDGTRYSHILDPRTGIGLTEHGGVTVIAPDATTADALATAVSVLGVDKGLKLIEQTPQTAAVIVQAAGPDDEQATVTRSPKYQEIVESY